MTRPWIISATTLFACLIRRGRKGVIILSHGRMRFVGLVHKPVLFRVVAKRANDNVRKHDKPWWLVRDAGEA